MVCDSMFDQNRQIAPRYAVPTYAKCNATLRLPNFARKGWGASAAWPAAAGWRMLIRGLTRRG